MKALVLSIAAIAAAPLAAPDDEPLDRAAILERFLAAGETPLVSYTATRTLTVAARGGKMKAFLIARATLDPVLDFQYEVLDEGGSTFLRSRVLHPVLEGERLARRRDKGAHGAITRANYVFTIGDVTPERGLHVAIKPRRKDELLMDGSIYLGSDDADLLGLEGLLVKRPSFWTRRVHIIRRYARIEGTRVPVATESTAEVLFAGQSTFSMSYEYETINGVTVAPGQPASQ
jgi:hypothetical protein